MISFHGYQFWVQCCNQVTRIEVTKSKWGILWHPVLVTYADKDTEVPLTALWKQASIDISFNTFWVALFEHFNTLPSIWCSNLFTCVKMFKNCCLKCDKDVLVWHYHSTHLGRVTHVCISKLTSLVQMISWHLVGTKTLSEPMLEYC